MNRLWLAILPALFCAAAAPADEPNATSRPAPATRPRNIIARPATRPVITTRPVPATRPAAAARPDAKVEALALCIGKDPEKPASPFGAAYEITLDIHIKNLNGKILGPHLPLMIKDFSDDKGTVLLRAAEIGGNRFSNSARLFVSPDKEAAAITIMGRIKPAPNAGKIILEASARLLIGSNIETTKIDNLRLHIGEKFTASGAELTVSGLHYYPSLSHDGIKTDNTMFDFSGFKNDGLQEVRVFDKTGTKISSGFPPVIDSIDRDPARARGVPLFAKDPPHDVALEVDYCKTVEEVEIPIKIEVPVAGSFYIGEIPGDYQRIVELSKLPKTEGKR